MAGMANVALALVLAGPGGLELMGVAVAGVVVLTVCNLLFTPLYAAYVIERPWWTFLSELIPTCLLTLYAAMGGWLISTTFAIESVFQLAIAVAVVLTLCIPVVWYVLLSQCERSSITAAFRVE